MLFRALIQKPPKNQPQEAHRARENERALPTEIRRQHQRCRRRNNRADICPRIKYTGRQRAFFFRKPFGDGLHGSGEIRGLANAEHEARDAEPHHAGRQGVSHPRDRPQDQSNRKAELDANFVQHAAPHQKHHGIRDLKRNHDAAVLRFRPANFGLQFRRKRP